MREAMKQRVTNVIGYTAVVVGVSITIPQIIKTLQTQRMEDVALGMVLLYVSNCILWLAYGILIKAKPVICGNAIGFVISMVLLALKLKFG
jgi:uncharacterized protein with PQ loop repeat